MARYADVIIDISHTRLDRPFTYAIPPDLEPKICEGTAVSVPFGRGGGVRTGYVVALRDEADYDPAQIKEIESICPLTVSVQSRQIELAAYMRDRYGGTFIQSLRTVLPARKKVQRRTPDKSPAVFPESCADDERLLTDEQQAVVYGICADYDAGIRDTYLVHGITGSGKTEVYMTLIEHVLALGRQAVMLIPEINLTYQTLARFTKRFGERVAVLNSSMSAGERYEQCERAARGVIDVIIGPRSAIFTPFPDIGIIIIDEEHDPGYKSEQTPKYHAREVAAKLASMHGASLVLGSATPSVDSYYMARTGRYKLYTLSKRATGAALSSVSVVDLREELRSGNKQIISRRLMAMLAQRLACGQQSMLFLNRRGYAGFVSCRACGEVVKCPHCDVSLTEHASGQLRCHYCGYIRDPLDSCPKCGSKQIGGFRAGTQQIETLVRQKFPSARVLRMDADTTARKDSYERILSTFAQGQADILVGTQMIVKGHDFPGVTLVGVIAADISLGTADYRASERTFQLLVQAAGRAGRGDSPGEVLIQTYQPEHYAVRFAALQDYEGFYEEELSYRRTLMYPPVCNMIGMQIYAKDEERGNKLAAWLTARARRYAKPLEVAVIGPAPAGISKIRDVYRYVFYLKHPDEEALFSVRDALERDFRDLKLRNEMLQADLNPVNSF